MNAKPYRIQKLSMIIILTLYKKSNILLTKHLKRAMSIHKLLLHGTRAKLKNRKNE